LGLIIFFKLSATDPENWEVLHVISETKLCDTDRSQLRTYGKVFVFFEFFVNFYFGRLKSFVRMEGLTYGEALPKFIKYFSDLFHLGPETVFVDIGSGIGDSLAFKRKYENTQSFFCCRWCVLYDKITLQL